MADTSPARIADRCTVRPTLGQGTFGRTLPARDDATHRDVAIRTLDPERVDSIKALEPFEREAAVLRSVQHPAVPEIFDSLRAA